MAIGFGFGPFGEYLFGETNWARRVTYDSLPLRIRGEDERQGFVLRDFLESYEKTLEEVRFKVRNIVNQRDPMRAIASSLKYDVVIDSSEVIEDPFWGRIVRAVVSNVGPAPDFQVPQDISALGIGWTAKIKNSGAAVDPLLESDVRTYKIVRIRSRNEPVSRNELLLAGPAVQLTNTEITFRNPSLLKFLAEDFDVLVDEEEPEEFQRSAVANAARLASIKTNKTSYSIRGRMAGFTVEAKGLYRIPSSFVPLLPGADVFEIPAGSGKYYTTLLARFILFDQVSADVQFDDSTLGKISILDHDIKVPDSSPDGVSPGQAFASNILAGYHDGFTAGMAVPRSDERVVWISSTAMDPIADAAILASIGLSAAYRTVISMTPRQRDLFQVVVEQGIFTLVDDVTGIGYPVEGEESYASGPQEWTIYTGNALVAGNYKLDYCSELTTNCDWCRSNVMVLEIQSTPELIAAFGGNGALELAAYRRLLEKLLRIIPVHVRFGGAVKKISIAIPGAGPGVGLIQNISIFIAEMIGAIVPFQAYYDLIAADEIYSDSVGPQISVTVTTSP